MQRISEAEAGFRVYKAWRVANGPQKLRVLVKEGKLAADENGMFDPEELKAVLAREAPNHKLFKATEIAEFIRREFAASVSTGTIRKWLREGSHTPAGRPVPLPSVPLATNPAHRGVLLKDLRKFCGLLGANLGRRGRPVGV